jgi:hypothetical protein
MIKKKAIVFSSVFFHSNIKVGSHHYAEALADQGYDVLYVSFPVSIFHFLFFFKSDNLARIFRRYRINKKNKIHSFIPFSILPLFNFFPFNSLFFLKNWVNFSDIYLDKRISYYLKNVDIVWIESSYFINVVKKIKINNPDVKIFTRLADNVLAFKNFPPKYVCLLNESFSISDRIVISAKSLKSIIDKKYEEKLIHLPNGINTTHMDGYSIEMPNEYRVDNNPIKIIYIGAIESWFDWGIIRHLLDNLANVSIYIIGPLGKNISKIENKNLHLLGSVPHDQIGRYIKNASIGIIPFIRNDLIDYVDPIKYYEYSYFGVPTVCTYWEEVSTFEDMIFLAKDKFEFYFQIKYLIDKKFMSGNLKVDLTSRDWKKNLKKLV